MNDWAILVVGINSAEEIGMVAIEKKVGEEEDDTAAAGTDHSGWLLLSITSLTRRPRPDQSRRPRNGSISVSQMDEIALSR